MEDIKLSNLTTALEKEFQYGRTISGISDKEFQFIAAPVWDKFNGINISSEMSFLIKEAGRICEYFASDMFYDLKELHGDLVSTPVLDHKDDYLWVVGIRDSGCDGKYYISNRLDDETAGRNYRALYAIRVVRTGSHWYKIAMRSIDVFRLQRAYNEAKQNTINPKED